MALPGRGVKVPARSRGTTGLKGPHPDESTVLDVVPFLALPRAWEVGSPLSYPRCSLKPSGQAPLQGLLDQGR